MIKSVDMNESVRGRLIMGCIDKVTHTLTCPKCGQTERDSVKDFGNRWSGSDWEEGPAFKFFTVIWDNRKNRAFEPKMLSAKCCTCGIEAKHEETYSM